MTANLNPCPPLSKKTPSGLKTASLMWLLPSQAGGAHQTKTAETTSSCHLALLGLSQTSPHAKACQTSAKWTISWSKRWSNCLPIFLVSGVYTDLPTVLTFPTESKIVGSSWSVTVWPGPYEHSTGHRSPKWRHRRQVSTARSQQLKPTVTDNLVCETAPCFVQSLTVGHERRIRVIDVEHEKATCLPMQCVHVHHSYEVAGSLMGFVGSS